VTTIGANNTAVSAYSDLYDVAVEVAGKAVAVAAATVGTLDPGLAPRVNDPTLPRELPKGTTHALGRADYSKMMTETKNSGLFVRALAVRGHLELPANRATLMKLLPHGVGDALGQSRPNDYLERRQVAYAFAGTASEAELTRMIEALSTTKGKSVEALTGDLATILNLVTFPRDPALNGRLIAGVAKHGISQADVDEHKEQHSGIA
jgi:hypothetical protein